MSVVRESIEIDATPDEVWEVVMDPRRLGDWVSAHEEVIDPPARLEPGSEFEQRLCVAGRRFGVRWHLEAAERPNQARWTATGPARSSAEVSYEFSASGGGTRFDYKNEFSPPGGRLNVVGRVVGGPPAKRAARKSLRALKQLLEG
ncbi:MAG: SRPBCC family protein [Thermoleophilaceae bacterium]|nr:SRPBCC family protein [Thermoleophilaceae bacterium]